MRRRSFFLTGLLTGAALLASCFALPAFAQEAGAPSVVADGVVEVVSGEARHRFAIEIADDVAERSRGLMYRRSMAEDTGMLFLYPDERIASFWMKNTYIPLDMLFVADDGTILQIAPMTEPHSLTPVRSDDPVRAVLEINGGLSEALGIAPGDSIVLYR